jgi:hypothetical protein
MKLLSVKLIAAEPVTAIVYHKNYFIKESAFITKEYKGISLAEYFKNNISVAERFEVMKCFATLLANFFKNGFSHNDLSLENFGIKKLEHGFEIVFIDIDSVRVKSFVSRQEVFKNLGKLSYYIYCTLASIDRLESYTKENIIILLKYFLDYYDPKIKAEDKVDYICKETIRRLISRGKKGLIKKESILYQHINSI